MGYYIGIDIGGTKTAVALYDGNFNRVGGVEIPSAPEKGCRDLTVRVGEAAREILGCASAAADAGGAVKVDAIGVASPGPLDLKSGRIVYIPTMGFRDEPLVKMLEYELGMPVALENDTNAAALCESMLGQGKGAETVVYITVSTGIGCGIVHKREIVDGAGFSAGELGHFKVERGGRPCPCGGRGCLEAYSSGTSVARIASELYRKELNAKETYALARSGDLVARGIVDEAAGYLGYAIAAVYQILDPDIVILGGGVANDYDVFSGALLDAVNQYTQYIPGREIKIRASGFGGGQVALGAALYAASKSAAVQ